MNAPRTISAEREADLRSMRDAAWSGSVDDLFTELDAERAAHAETLAALERAAVRLGVYGEWASREIIASRGSQVYRWISEGADKDVRDARAALASAAERGAK